MIRGAVEPLYSVRGLSVTYAGGGRGVEAVRDLSLDLRRGEILAVVGESGSGKSSLGRALAGLLPAGGSASAARWDFDGRDLEGAGESTWRELRGRRIGMVFQDPATCLNPVLRVRQHLLETIRLHSPELTREQAVVRAGELLTRLGVPKERLSAFPHQLSGGMRQRVMIALANACGAEVLIADEPTTALDVIVQARFLTLLERLVREERLAVLLITHDLGIVDDVADRVAVMYAGELVELGTRDEVIGSPRHPYTRALVDSVPRIDGKGTRAARLRGLPPDLSAPPPGCRFHPRCPVALKRCPSDEPPSVHPSDEALVRCWLHAPNEEGT